MIVKLAFARLLLAMGNRIDPKIDDRPVASLAAPSVLVKIGHVIFEAERSGVPQSEIIAALETALRCELRIAKRDRAA